MARNIEIKARVADMDALRARTAAIADSGPVEIPQDDTFFRCASGRLKLRVFEDRQGALVEGAYHDLLRARSAASRALPRADACGQ